MLHFKILHARQFNFPRKYFRALNLRYYQTVLLAIPDHQFLFPIGWYFVAEIWYFIKQKKFCGEEQQKNAKKVFESVKQYS